MGHNAATPSVYTNVAWPTSILAAMGRPYDKRHPPRCLYEQWDVTVMTTVSGTLDRPNVPKNCYQVKMQLPYPLLLALFPKSIILSHQ